MDSTKRKNQEEIRLDEHGNWYQGEFPILHDRTIQFLHRNINIDEEGRYYLSGEDRPVYFKVDDAPYQITKIEKTIVGLLINLTDESVELLEPQSLWRGKNDALYCLVKGGKLPAKFTRSAHHDFLSNLEGEEGSYQVVINKKTYKISDKAPDIPALNPRKKKVKRVLPLDIQRKEEEKNKEKIKAQIQAQEKERAKLEKEKEARAKLGISEISQKATTKKASGKSSSAKKESAKKSTRKNTSSKKGETKEVASKKSSPKKPATKKTTPKKASTKKVTSTNKKNAKKSSTKKVAAKKSTPKKTTTKETQAKKTSTKKSTTKKSNVKKTTAKKAVTKKAATKKAAPKKSTAKKSSSKK